MNLLAMLNPHAVRLDYSQDYKAITVNRPQTIGLRFTYKFVGA